MKSTKSFILGMAAGLMLAGITVFASTGIDAIMNYAKVQINGADVTSDNFYYDGKTYVWIRDVADMFGKDIAWNEEAKTANIVEKGAAPTVYVPIETDDTIALTVDNVKVTAQEIKALAYSNLVDTSDKAKGEAIKSATETALNTSIAITAAEKDGVLLPAEVKEQLKSTVNTYLTAADNKGFFDFLAKNALTADLYVNIMEKMQYEGIYAQDLKNKGLIPEKDIKDYFEKNKADLQKVTAKHILIKDAEGVDSKKIATDIYKGLLKGDDFDKVMKEKSQDPGLESNPDGYTFGKGEMVKEFEDAAFTQDVKKLYAPVKSSFGYHVIYVTKRDVPKFEDSKAACIDKIFYDWYKGYLKDISKNMKIEVNEEIINGIKLD